MACGERTDGKPCCEECGKKAAPRKRLTFSETADELRRQRAEFLPRAMAGEVPYQVAIAYIDNVLNQMANLVQSVQAIKK